MSERRVCSVLFADLVGFTTLSEARDPEEVRELLSVYFATARTIIGRYGGVVEKFIGDAVMAVWGTPVAVEGDAERAVRAGLDLVAAARTLGEGVELRAGVVTGEVAVTVGAVGEGMVAGDAVNTAARVQSAASPGTVWVDESTQRLTAAAIGFHAAGTHELKGKAEPVALWEATRVQANVGGAQRIDGLEAPLIGRAVEERTLRDLFHASVDRRTPALVVLNGPAGSGKSRLGWEFEKYVDGLADALYWHRGRCLNYGDGVAYWALAEAMRQRFGISEEETPQGATRRFVERLAELVPDETQRSFMGVRLGRLLGLTHPDDPGGSLDRDDLFAGWRVFLEHLAASEPVVLLVEDAQHADDGLLDFLEHVVDWARQAPIYLLVFGRSELVDRRPGLGVGRHRTTLTLDALDDRSMRELVGALVHDLPDDVVTAIARQAEGNPLFAVETIRSLVDRDVIVPIGGEYRLAPGHTDVGALTVPDSLHGLLAARLDALDPDLRSLVADAAVLGTSFPSEALAGVSGRPVEQVSTALAELVRRGVLEISTDPLSPQRGSYGFSQGMLRTVAYETLSRRDRKARHLAVAEHLQGVFTGGGDEVMEVVAQHYLDALEAAAADDADRDEIREHAFSSLLRAAERSRRAGALDRSGTLLERAASLADPGRAAALWEQATTTWADEGDFTRSLTAATRSGEQYAELGDGRAVARLRTYQGRALRLMGRHTEAQPVIAEALEVLQDPPDLDTVEALAQASATGAFMGEGDVARELGERALGLGQQLGAPLGQLANLFLNQGIAHMFANRLHQALASFSYAQTLAAQSGDASVAARASLNMASLQALDDPAAAVESAGRAIEVARLHGFRDSLGVATFNQALGRLATGAWDEALTALDLVVDEHALGFQYLDALRAVVHAMRGDVERAAETALHLDQLRTSDDVQDTATAAWVDVVVAAESGDPAATVEHARLIADLSAGLVNEATCWAFGTGVRAALDLDDLDAAHDLFARLGDHALGAAPLVMRGDLASLRARVLAADGAPVEDVDAAFEAALAELRSAGFPHQLGHGLLDRATHLRATGRDASHELDEAVLLAERLGAADLRRRALALGVPDVAVG